MIYITALGNKGHIHLEKGEDFTMHHTNASPKQQNIIGLTLMALLSLLVILISSPAYASLHRMARADLPKPSVELTDGTYTYEDPEADDSGFKNRVSMTVFDGYITSVSWDCVSADGASKRQLSLDGQYTMTEDGPLWSEQSDAASSYVVTNQTLDGLIDENGYTQAVASVSINLYGFYNGVNDCIAQASQSNTPQ